jgi:Domain of Unknown Function (DUF1259)
MMGDMVLDEDQVNPVMTVVLESGLEVTALHNHFLWESSIVMFMHIGGMGDEAALATAVGKVFAKIKETEQRAGSDEDRGHRSGTYDTGPEESRLASRHEGRFHRRHRQWSSRHSDPRPSASNRG